MQSTCFLKCQRGHPGEGKDERRGLGRDTFYPFPFQFHPKQCLRKPISSHNWLCLGTTDAEVGVQQQKVSAPQRESDSQEHRVSEETLA